MPYLNSYFNYFLFYLIKKQSGFQKDCFTEQAIFKLTDRINNDFEKNCYTLGMLIDLAKAFHAVDHKIYLKS